ncbi:MAG: DegT/DnrJ/EryC1/StrS family aminotransferase [Bacteroidota bacterium]|nr:DegT/DnrJ/EryC1/StrS family aminotransferase [Bacteroidota bacterium]
MKIPFSPPYIDDDVINEVTDSLKSGWITSGPKVKALEELTAEFSSLKYVACVNSWTSGAQLVLKWFGVGPGDEVIVPAYTYAATALVVLHCGAKPVMVDVLEDFTIDPEKVKKAITSKTKVIFAVDFAGYPCNYDVLNEIISNQDIKEKFSPSNTIQSKMNSILLVSDAAHSIGAKYKDSPAAIFSDITIYSFHAVKNVTTAEGGAICLNLPSQFDNETEYKWLKLNSLNGQTKDAFTKSQAGGWKYDIISQGLKVNMPDICAAIGLAQLRKYKDKLLVERKQIFDSYANAFSKCEWALTPPSITEKKSSSFHLFALRIKGITESQRDAIIDEITKSEITVNVHFIPLPMLTLFKELGYSINDFPQAYENYSQEISLPIYPQLTSEQVGLIIDSVTKAVEKVITASI